MILVDTSVWVDHLRSGDAQLAELLLQDLPAAVVAEVDEILSFIELRHIDGKGIGYVDAHLLASAALTKGALLWTRDKSLRLAATELGSAFADSGSH